MRFSLLATQLKYKIRSSWDEKHWNVNKEERESIAEQFELLPNGYCHKDCCSCILWFLFHTIDGDIIMGQRKRVTSTEWQENYKPFDMDELFGTEDVTKLERGNK